MTLRELYLVSVVKADQGVFRILCFFIKNVFNPLEVFPRAWLHTKLSISIASDANVFVPLCFKITVETNRRKKWNLSHFEKGHDVHRLEGLVSNGFKVSFDSALLVGVSLDVHKQDTLVQHEGKYQSLEHYRNCSANQSLICISLSIEVQHHLVSEHVVIFHKF